MVYIIPLIKKCCGINLFKFTVNKDVDEVEFPTSTTIKKASERRDNFIHTPKGTECG